MEQSEYQKNLEKLANFIGPEGKIALSNLCNSMLLKKQTKSKEYDNEISNRRAELVNSVVKKLYDAVHGCKSKEILHATTSGDGKHPGPLLFSMVDGILNMFVNEKDEIVVSCGVDNTCSVSMKDFANCDIENIQQLSNVCSEINILWKGSVKIDCSKNEKNDIVNFHFNGVELFEV